MVQVTKMSNSKDVFASSYHVLTYLFIFRSSKLHRRNNENIFAFSQLHILVTLLFQSNLFISDVQIFISSYPYTFSYWSISFCVREPSPRSSRANHRFYASLAVGHTFRVKKKKNWTHRGNAAQYCNFFAPPTRHSEFLHAALVLAAL